jgi:STE24 endopeptidase
VLLKMGAELVLDGLNRRQVVEKADAVPAAYRDTMDEATYDKSVSYTLVKTRMSMFETVFDGIVLALVLYSGLLPWLWEMLTGLTGSGLWGQSLSLFAIFTLLGLPGLPLEWWNQFRIEEQFGFNKSTIGLWISDKIKGLLVAAVLGIPALTFIIWLVGLTQFWWFWGFAGFFLFQLVLVVVYPMFIMPLFNKFEPLPEGDLRERLMALGERTGFLAKTILVMDGSKRSGHSNAYFTGFGRFRRIVLYDTLVEQMEARELEAVLAHEIGHYKLGHIPKLMALSAVSLFLSFFLMNWLMQSEWFVTAFGFSPASGLGPVILLFGLLAGLVTFWISPLSNALSRKHEYEADAFARRALDNDPAPLRMALRILSKKNLSNLTPHPVYSGFYYSHPTLLERERALVGEG